GRIVRRFRCSLPPTGQDNNIGRVPVSSPGGSFVTEGCHRGQLGPLRECGLREQGALRSCTPGHPVRVRCSPRHGARVRRCCGRSEALGVGVACARREAAANKIVSSRGSTTVSFPCPAVRDAAPGTGGYSVYEAPVLPSLGPAAVTCTGF